MKFVVLLQSLARTGCLATVNWNIIKRPHVKLVKTNFNHPMLDAQLVFQLWQDLGSDSLAEPDRQTPFWLTGILRYWQNCLNRQAVQFFLACNRQQPLLQPCQCQCNQIRELKKCNMLYCCISSSLSISTPYASRVVNKWPYELVSDRIKQDSPKHDLFYFPWVEMECFLQYQRASTCKIVMISISINCYKNWKRILIQLSDIH